ncbi:MAG: CHAP domain-containing protein [Chloroflexota bacterium]|nr:CHAP domain-containing protein [Chloroflexota bacterium]
MSSFDDRRDSAGARQSPIGGPVQLPGLVSQHSPADQLPFSGQLSAPGNGTSYPPEYTAAPAVTRALSPDPISTPGISDLQSGPVSEPGITRQLPGPVSESGITRQLQGFHSSPGVTRNLSEAQTGALLPATNGPVARAPIVIRGGGKKRQEAIPRSRKRRALIHTSVMAFIVLILLGTLLTVLPEGATGANGFNPFKSAWGLVNGNGSNASKIAMQAATVTAVTQDGYDHGNQNYAGLPAPPPGGSSLNRFAYGQCTYWANMRYHQLSGQWVSWRGNAYQWSYGARASGWVVSATPRVPSIMVLQPGVQGAGGYGHVAVVERINSDGSVYTSNYNWYSNGGWNRLSYVTFQPGPGVSFVWHP